MEVNSLETLFYEKPREEEPLTITITIEGYDNKRLRNINIGSMDVEFDEPERFSVSRYENGQLREIRSEKEISNG